MQKVETLCKITSAIHNSAAGWILKKKMMDAGLVADACKYLAENHPPIFNLSVMGHEWKYFLTKPSLKYVLKLMAGMARAHKPSQVTILCCIGIICHWCILLLCNSVYNARLFALRYDSSKRFCALYQLDIHKL